MDVSGWTVDQRMRLPDWCFGNRQIIGCQVLAVQPTTHYWGISAIGLPDPVCIWSVGFWFRIDAYSKMSLEIGLAHNVPTNNAEMAACQEIFPHFGAAQPGPNTMRVGQRYSVPLQIEVRKGMITSGKKLVADFYSTLADARVDVYLVVSGLPTSMAGWLAHHKI